MRTFGRAFAPRRVEEFDELSRGWRGDAWADLELRIGRLRVLSTHVHFWPHQWDVIDRMRERLASLKREAGMRTSFQLED